MAGLCSDGGSDDKQQHAANTQDARDDFPLIGCFALLKELFFCLDKVSLKLLVVVEPSCVGAGGSQDHHQEDDEFDGFAFHWV